MNASLEPLTTITIWICVIGVVAAVLVWLLGRRDVRAGVVAVGKRAAGQAAEVKIPDSPVTSWIGNHVVAVRWGLLVVGLIVLSIVASSWLGHHPGDRDRPAAAGRAQPDRRAVAVRRAGQRRGGARLSAGAAAAAGRPPRSGAGHHGGVQEPGPAQGRVSPG